MRKLIGLLGGSFNPAHLGHVHISLEARAKLPLPMVWWLVSPQNPLKPTAGMAPFAARFAGAQKITQNSKSIHVSDIEQRMNTRYTVDTLRKLKKRYPRTQFVWLMGADNLASIHRWEEWQAIFHLVPVLILDRAPFSHNALRQKAALRFRKHRKPVRALLFQAKNGLPAWSYVHMRRHKASSTAIRKNLEKTEK